MSEWVVSVTTRIVVDAEDDDQARRIALDSLQRWIEDDSLELRIATEDEAANDHA